MEYYWHDFFEKIVVPALFDDSPDREKIIKKLAEIDIPNELPKLAKLLKDRNKRKYVCGNELCIYDFQFAGIFVNLILNPHAQY